MKFLKQILYKLASTMNIVYDHKYHEFYKYFYEYVIITTAFINLFNILSNYSDDCVVIMIQQYVFLLIITVIPDHFY